MNISNFQGYDLIALASSIAVLISKNLTSDELGVLSGFFSAIGDNLAILASIPTNNNQQKNT